MYTHHNTCDVLQCWIAWSWTNSESSLPLSYPGQVSDENSKHRFMGSLKKNKRNSYDLVTTCDNYSIKKSPWWFPMCSWLTTISAWVESLQNTKLECFGAICWIHDQYQGHLPKNYPKRTSEIKTGRSHEQFQKKNTFVNLLLFIILLVAWETDPYCNGCL